MEVAPVPVIERIAQASAGGAKRVYVFTSARPGTLEAAALVAAVANAAIGAVPAAELEPRFIPDSTLARWERSASASLPARGAMDDSSDGRWLWAAALVLLALEAWLRRRPAPKTDTETSRHAHERIA
jgi:hypothetical protein